MIDRSIDPSINQSINQPISQFISSRHSPYKKKKKQNIELQLRSINKAYANR